MSQLSRDEGIECIASLNLLAPGGHYIVVRVHVHDAGGYFATWPFPAIRNGEACYRYHCTGDHRTMQGAMNAAIEQVRNMPQA